MELNKRPIYQQIAVLAQACKNCEKSNNAEWYAKHKKNLRDIENELPSGSGIDCGTKIDLDQSTGERIVLLFDYHFMNENGYYTKWESYKAIITPSLQFNFNLRIIGLNKAGIKDYFYDIYSIALQ